MLLLLGGCAGLRLAHMDVSHFVVMGPSGPVVRVLVPVDERCPHVQVDGRDVSLVARLGSKDFDIKICEAQVSGKRVRVAGDEIVIGPSELNRVVILGDTGCRVKNVPDQPVELQDCSHAWEFPKIAETAGSENPDLVIHVGDYMYRESACPAELGCAGEPFGDTFPSWYQDFLKPAQPLLQKAPWVMVRGNHELCHRAGAGWQELLDPEVYQAVCRIRNAAYRVDIGQLSIGVLDSSLANDLRTTDVFQDIGQDVAKLAGVSWLVTHKPIWLATASKGRPISLSASMSALEALESAHAVLNSLQVAFAGHFHFFSLGEVLRGPYQVIVGNGGALMAQLPEKGTYQFPAYTIKTHEMIRQYGYTLMTKIPDGWLLEAKSTEGEVLFEKKLMRRR